MKKKRLNLSLGLFTLIVLLTVFISVATALIINDSTGVPEIYDKQIIESNALLESREIIIKEPDNFNPQLEYPLILVIGGNSLTFSVSHDVDVLSRSGAIKESIVVGIPNIDQSSRQRDLTPPFLKQDLDEEYSSLGEADKYLEFIENEVLRYLEGRYNINHKGIIGHSREGLLIMYSLMKNPALFDFRIALSPALWRENNKFVSHFERFLTDSPTLGSSLFMSMGEHEVTKMKKAFDLASSTLEKHAAIDLKWEAYYTPNANHQNNHYLTACIGIYNFLKV